MFKHDEVSDIADACALTAPRARDAGAAITGCIKGLGYMTRRLRRRHIPTDALGVWCQNGSSRRSVAATNARQDQHVTNVRRDPARTAGDSVYDPAFGPCVGC